MRIAVAERAARTETGLAKRSWYRNDTSMKSIHVRDIEERTLRGLKRLAKTHHRSLQGELHVIIERAARMAPLEETEDTLPLVTVNRGGKASWRREEMYGPSGR
jgi:plasmid stability protein